MHKFAYSCILVFYSCEIRLRFMIFHDRTDAGQKLAQALAKFKNTQDTIILALPRGGVVVGFEVAKELNLPLDIVVPRKIGAPDNEEFAIGAITESGEGIFNQEIISTYGISQEYIDKTVAKEKKKPNAGLKPIAAIDRHWI